MIGLKSPQECFHGMTQNQLVNLENVGTHMALVIFGGVRKFDKITCRLNVSFTFNANSLKTNLKKLILLEL